MARRDQRSAEAQAYRGWYKLAKWKALRARQLKRHPLCAICARVGRITAASVADHIRPHKGDPGLFWSAENLQSSCAPCHDGAKQSWERNGTVEVGEDGWPVV